MMKPASKTRFLNVDLEIRGKNGLQKLLAAFADRAFDLHFSDDLLRVELNNEVEGSLDKTLHDFVRLIQVLPPEARKIWDSCDSRCFDIGLQSGAEPFSERFIISAEALTGISTIGGNIAVTVYAPVKE